MTCNKANEGELLSRNTYRK